jgi:site-specific DNA-methyltransferase (adenine-specific)
MAVRPSREATITIYEEDCVSGIEKRVRRGSVSVAVTSPPYNLGKSYGTYRDKRDPQEYLTWIGQVARSVSWALSDDGSFFMNVGNKPSAPWWPMEVAKSVLDTGFQLQNTILWIKSIAISQSEMGDYPNVAGDFAVGHYKPVNSRRYLNGLSEYIFHFTKNGNVELDKLGVGVPYQDKTNVDRWGSAASDIRDRGNVWFIPYDTVHAARGHPCIFPVRLPEMCIQVHGLKKTKLVLDPFLGTGSTALACDRLGVDCVGFDVDGEYVAMAQKALILQRAARQERRAANAGWDAASEWRATRDLP